MAQFNYKRTLIWLLIIALSLAALTGIIIFLIGDFGEIGARILLTTLALGGYSLTGLCSAMLQKYPRYKMFSNIGMLVAFLGFIVATLFTWEILDMDDIWEVVIIFIVLSIGIAHASLLLQIKPKSKQLKIIRSLTIGFIAIVTLMLIRSTIGNFNESDLYYRLLGVFAILDVLGSIATPILNGVLDQEK